MRIDPPGNSRNNDRLFKPWILFPFVYAFTMAASLVYEPANALETGSSHNLFILDRLGEKSFFVGRANLVTRDGFSDTFFGYADINYRHVLDNHWAVEAGYRQAWLELPGGWREEYRPMFALYWRGILAGGRFSNRNRIELRYFEGNAKDRVRYRNESVWTSPKKVTGLELTPFVEEEFFYDLTDSEFNTNWFTVGFSKFLRPGVKWKLGYRLQHQKSNDRWSSRHVLVTGISLLDFD